MDGSVRLGWPWFGDEEISTLVWIRKLLDFWQASSLQASFNFIYLFFKKKKEKREKKKKKKKKNSSIDHMQIRWRMQDGNVV
jgi:hypothetical protein